jgi:hypothetical protein
MSVPSRRAVKNSLMMGAISRMGICEKLRFIYDEVHELEDAGAKERITELLVDAMIMGKKMSDRLNYYKKTYNDTTGSGGKNIAGIAGASSRKKFRRARYD